MRRWRTPRTSRPNGCWRFPLRRDRPDPTATQTIDAVRFKVDQNLPVEIAVALREAGHDAHTVYEEALAGTPDSELGVIVQRERRGLVTLDLGFGDLRNYPPRDYQGIIVLRPSRQDKATVLQLFASVIPLLAHEMLVGRLWIVDERRVRVRG